MESTLSKSTHTTEAVKAVYVTTDTQRRAFRVVDAVDDLSADLGAFRAVESLAMNEKIGGEDCLPQLKRRELATLLNVLTNNLEAHCAAAREAAVVSATGMAEIRP